MADYNASQISNAVYDSSKGAVKTSDVSDASVTLTHTAVNVTTSTGAALAANASRKYALLVNDSDSVQYIKIGASAVLHEGIRLDANGGSYEMSPKAGNLDPRAINAIHGSTGSKVLLVTEG